MSRDNDEILYKLDSLLAICTGMDTRLRGLEEKTTRLEEKVARIEGRLEEQSGLLHALIPRRIAAVRERSEDVKHR